MLRAARISAKVVDSGCSVVGVAGERGDFFVSVTVAGKMLVSPPSVSVETTYIVNPTDTHTLCSQKKGWLHI